LLVGTLQRQSKATESYLLHVAQTASRRYRVYQIPKKTAGTRTIEHPSRQLKAIQSWISKFLFRRFPVHECATAYKRGSNIRDNAKMHLSTNFTLRVDFKDFFPSFSSEGVSQFLISSNSHFEMGLDERDIEFVTSIVSRNGRLTIGAPSSPILTNAMMYPFDKAISDFSLSNCLVYTRYADDIFISTSRPNGLNGAFEKIRSEAENFSFADLSINEGKTAYLSKRYKRAITGLVMTTANKVSIGRERKREIKTLVYLYTKRKLAKEKIGYLRGVIAFVFDVELSFYNSLSDKFDPKVLSDLLRQDG